MSLNLQFLVSYAAKYVKEYIEGAKPVFSIGEFWDSCNYHNSRLAYNQGTYMFNLKIYFVLILWKY